MLDPPIESTGDVPLITLPEDPRAESSSSRSTSSSDISGQSLRRAIKKRKIWIAKTPMPTMGPCPMAKARIKRNQRGARAVPQTIPTPSRLNPIPSPNPPHLKAPRAEPVSPRMEPRPF